MLLATGTTVGPYAILSVLGEGGMGEVYLAQDARLGRRVALKVLRQDIESGEIAKRRFGQEAQTASALNHPNIVSIFDVGQADGLDFIAMEYIEGRTLRDMLRDGRIEIKRALELVAQAAAGLAAAHDAHIVHRDIKPENLMVARSGQLKVLDFGVAKLVEKQLALIAGQAGTTTETPALTRVGTIVGTTAYMSPEQVQGDQVDGQSDIFSLGVVLYESLTGGKAFAGPSVIDVLHAIINAAPRPAIEVNPELPVEVLDLFDKALAKDPANRYRHAGDFELDLRRFKGAFENGALPSQRALNSRARARGSTAVQFGVAATIGLALGSVGVWLLSASAPTSLASSGLENATLAPLTTDAGFEGDPSFSLDGETLAYVSDRTGNFEIF